jgi:hypothetical protein
MTGSEGAEHLSPGGHESSEWGSHGMPSVSPWEPEDVAVDGSPLEDVSVAVVPVAAVPVADVAAEDVSADSVSVEDAPVDEVVEEVSPSPGATFAHATSTRQAANNRRSAGNRVVKTAIVARRLTRPARRGAPIG